MFCSVSSLEIITFKKKIYIKRRKEKREANSKEVENGSSNLIIEICKNRPFYGVMAADSRSPRDGKHMEVLIYYNPLPGYHLSLFFH